MAVDSEEFELGYCCSEDLAEDGLADASFSNQENWFSVEKTLVDKHGQSFELLTGNYSRNAFVL